MKSSRNLGGAVLVRDKRQREQVVAALAERDEALLRERARLYVAASRARDELVITYSGTPSPLLPDGLTGSPDRRTRTS